MSDLYKTTIIGTNIIGKTAEKIIQISRQDHKKIKADEIKILFKEIKKNLDKKGKQYKIYVRGMGGIRFHTLTKNNELNVKNDAEYFEGRVKSPDIFTDFYFLQITVIDETPINKKS